MRSKVCTHGRYSDRVRRFLLGCPNSVPKSPRRSIAQMNRLPVRAALIAARRRPARALRRRLRLERRLTASAPDAKTLSFKLTDAGCDPHDAQGAGRADQLRGRRRERLGHRARGARRRNDPRREGEPDRRPDRQLLADPRGRRIHAALQRRLRRRRDAEGDRQARRRRPAPRSKRRSPSTANTWSKTPPSWSPRRSRSSPPSSPANVAKAKALYPAARIPYERIEPVAESFGDLDPRIDARENDVPAERIRRLPPDRESALGGRHRRRAWRRSPNSCWPTSKNCERR